MTQKQQYAFNVINTIDQFKLVKIGTMVYRVLAGDIKKYYYAGINPKCENGIMLISGSNVQNMEGSYLGNKNIEYFLDYQMACEALLKDAEKRVETIRRIYIDRK